MVVEFFLAMIPPTVTHQEKDIAVRGGKPVVYEPPKLKAARQKFLACLWPRRPERKLRGAVRLCVKWCFPMPELGRHWSGEYKTTKPDTDNLQKLLRDCMTRCGFWEDDAQVACEIVEKFWAELPGIYISAEEIYEV